MLKVIGDKAQAVNAARDLAKRSDNIHMYETTSGRFFVTDEVRPDLREIPFEKVSIRAIREYDVEYMEDIPMNERRFGTQFSSMT